MKGLDPKTKSPEVDQLFKMLEQSGAETHAFIDQIVESLDRGELPKSEQLSTLVYRLAISMMVDDLSESLAKGRLFLRAQLSRMIEKGFNLEKLERVLNLKAPGTKLEIQVPFAPELFEPANRNLSRITDGQRKLSDYIKFVRDPNKVFEMEKAFPGADTRKAEAVSKWRSRIIPELAFVSCFISGLMLQMGISPNGPGAFTEFLSRAAPLLPWLGGGIGVAAAVRYLPKSEFGSWGRAGEWMKNPHVTGGIISLVTLFGVAHHLGPKASLLMLMSIAVGATVKFLEWQFSQFTDFWSKWAANIKWFDVLFKPVHKAFVKAGEKHPSIQTLYERGVRPGIGLFTNFSINAAYETAMGVGRSLGSLLALGLSWTAGALFASQLVGADELQFGISLGTNELKGALYFMAAVGALQVVIGNLTKKGEITELPRRILEFFSVAYNGGIARVLKVIMGQASSIGSQMMWGFAGVITLPAVLYFMFLPVVERFGDGYRSHILQNGGVPWYFAPYMLAKRGVDALGRACGFSKARKFSRTAQAPAPAPARP